MADFVRLRRALAEPVALSGLAPGVEILPLWRSKPIELHRLLGRAYADGGGTVDNFDQWWWPLVEDAEFDPELVVILADAAGDPLGLVQCWTSSFVKDIVVDPSARNRGLGSALLTRAFALLRERGHPHVDLKVEATNSAARRFYARHGMTEVDS
ncbi:GNAT family N-acetyltransferase [Devosia salina]|uniref:GNAT family N-acetyltransferase n=1 Tax=Devosia salina TaxID=2860336 RepID=A0ABX8WAJ8_9HYPH|nr:GNAT family N-acetyltransferase [Devosia salina]QYO75468.1 GNAT family N-acetyltransferase [Devosia salina]